MLPKIPSQTKSFEKEVGYLCSGNLTLDHNHTGHHRDEEFKELMKWVLDELKLRGVEFQK